MCWFNMLIVNFFFYVHVCVRHRPDELIYYQNIISEFRSHYAPANITVRLSVIKTNIEFYFQAGLGHHFEAHTGFST